MLENRGRGRIENANRKGGILFPGGKVIVSWGFCSGWKSDGTGIGRKYSIGGGGLHI